MTALWYSAAHSGKTVQAMPQKKVRSGHDSFFISSVGRYLCTSRRSLISFQPCLTAQSGQFYFTFNSFMLMVLITSFLSARMS